MEYIRLVRSAQHRYELDKLENQHLRALSSAIDQARDELETRLAGYYERGSDWSATRAEAVLAEVETLAEAVYDKIGAGVVNTSMAAGEMSVVEHENILSFDGRVAGFNNIALSPGQIRAAIVDTPLGGFLLQEWLARSYSHVVMGQFRQEVLAGMLQGEGYPKLTRRVQDMFDMTKREATTLTRTYVQQINNDAQHAVMQANADILKGWKWSAVTENGDFGAGRGICLRCLSLDSRGEVYQLDGGPPIPLHPNCRCVRRTVTKPWVELGLDMDEIRDNYRPYAIRGKVDPVTGKLHQRAVGTGRSGDIVDAGQFLGGYEDWFKTIPRDVQIQTLGPRRWELWSAGEIKLKDLADARGNLRLVDELRGQVKRVGLEQFIDDKGALRRVLKAATSDPLTAYELARAGRGMVKFYERYKDVSDKELLKSIKSLRKQIGRHVSWIADPTTKNPDFHSLNERMQTDLVTNKWPKDILRHIKYINVIEGILGERGVKK